MKETILKPKNIHRIIIFLFFVSFALLIYYGYIQNTPIVNTYKQVTQAFSPIQSDSSDVLSKFHNYLDIIVAVYASLLIGYSAASITLFALLRSAIERTQDENPMMGTILKVFSERTSKLLFYNLFACFIGLTFGLIFHYVSCFQSRNEMWLSERLIVMIILFVVISTDTGYFWHLCVSTPKQYVKIAEKQWKFFSSDLETSNSNSKMDESASHDDMVPHDADNFALLLSKIDQLLRMNNPQGAHDKPTTIDEINNILTERWSVLSPMNQNIEQIPRYNDYDETLQKNNRQFQYSESWKTLTRHILDIYRALDGCRCIILSIPLNEEICKKSKEQFQLDPDVHGKAALFLWYVTLYFFTSCIRIVDFTYNGATFCDANFFNSHLERNTLYGAKFKNCFWGYAKLSDSSLDMSSFSSVWFEHTRFQHTSLTNSIFKNCSFNGAIGQNSDVSRCAFENGQVADSDWKDCFWNDCIFTGIALSNMSFSNSELNNWILKDCRIEKCSFDYSRIAKWEFQNNPGNPILHDCSFVGSTLTDFTIEGADMSSSNFKDAILTNVVFKNINLNQSMFACADLPFSKLNNVKMEGSDLSKSNLFQSTWDSVNLNYSNLLFTKAQAIHMNDCQLKQCNCADSDWSRFNAEKVDMTAIRLTECRLTEAELNSCILIEALATNIQLTNATCKTVNFSYSMLTNSNFAKTSFIQCKFHYADLTEIGATNTIFVECEFNNADFSNTRFVQAVWRGRCKAHPMIVAGANFSSCVFINCKMRDIVFQGCELDGAVFENCDFNDVAFTSKISKKAFINCKFKKQRIIL